VLLINEGRIQQGATVRFKVYGGGSEYHYAVAELVRFSPVFSTNPLRTGHASALVRPVSGTVEPWYSVGTDGLVEVQAYDLHPDDYGALQRGCAALYVNVGRWFSISTEGLHYDGS
jgi:hypothetical protein